MFAILKCMFVLRKSCWSGSLPAYTAYAAIRCSGIKLYEPTAVRPIERIKVLICVLDGVEECQERASVQCPKWSGCLRLYLHQHDCRAGGAGRRAASPVWRPAVLANSQAGGPGGRQSGEAHHHPDQSAYRERFVLHWSSSDLIFDFTQHCSRMMWFWQLSSD